MAFEKTLPTWNNQGVEPPESLKTAGWEANQKPPAPYFNWLQNTTYEAIKELQEKAADKSEISIPDASTTQKGAVQLTTSTDSTSTTLAPTASALKALKDSISYQTPTLSGVQIRLVNNTNSSRLFFKLNTSLNGNITISTDGGTTSKNLVDADGVQVTSLDKGFVEVVAESNFFILRNSGMSKSDLQQLIAIANEAEANESVMKTNYINAVNSADSSITLPSDASWNDVLLQIPNINSNNKKWATGTSTGSGKVTINGLDFNPSFVFLYLTNPTNTVRFITHTIYKESIPFYNSSQQPRAFIVSDNGTSVVASKYDMNYENISLFDGGFSYHNGIYSAAQFNWIAIE